MIDVRQLTKNYGSVAALRGVSFEVGRGEVVGFVGPNGAGKSTTLRILTGFIGASSGSVSIDGHDVAKEPMRARESLGYMPETAPLYPELRVHEYLRFRARLKGVPSKTQARELGRAMDQAGVQNVRGRLIGQLSKGYRQRVALADALVANPPLLILDEPTSGLDPNQIKEVRRLLKQLGDSHTILLSTHILSEVESTCDRALVIHQGRLVLQGALHDLRDEQLRATFTLHDPEHRSARLVAEVQGIARCKVQDERGAHIELGVQLERNRGPETLERAVQALVGAGVGVRGLAREKRRLEDVFSELTSTQGIRDPESQ